MVSFIADESSVVRFLNFNYLLVITLSYTQATNGSNGFAANHKGYLKNMLVSRLMKKLPSITDSQRRLIESEVQIFVNREYLTKDTMR